MFTPSWLVQDFEEIHRMFLTGSPRNLMRIELIELIEFWFLHGNGHGVFNHSANDHMIPPIVPHVHLVPWFAYEEWWFSISIPSLSSLLQHQTFTLFQYYSITVLQYYSITVLQYYSITALYFHTVSVLQYYSITVLQYYTIIIIIITIIIIIIITIITIKLHYQHDCYHWCHYYTIVIDYHCSVVSNIFVFPHLGNCIIPGDLHIFPRGFSTTNKWKKGWTHWNHRTTNRLSNFLWLSLLLWGFPKIGVPLVIHFNGIFP